MAKLKRLVPSPSKTGREETKRAPFYVSLSYVLMWATRRKVLLSESLLIKAQHSLYDPTPNQPWGCYQKIQISVENKENMKMTTPAEHSLPFPEERDVPEGHLSDHRRHIAELLVDCIRKQGKSSLPPHCYRERWPYALKHLNVVAEGQNGLENLEMFQRHFCSPLVPSWQFPMQKGSFISGNQPLYLYTANTHNIANLCNSLITSVISSVLQKRRCRHQAATHRAPATPPETQQTQTVQEAKNNSRSKQVSESVLP